MEGIIIDLNNNHRGKKNIALQWNISVEDRDEGIGSRFAFFRKHQRIEKQVSLIINRLSIDKRLICEQASLFSIVYEGEEYQQADLPLAIKIKQLITNFQLFINLDAIKDCKEQQERTPKTYNIEVELAVIDKKNVIIHSESETINIKFAFLDIKPRIELYLIQDRIQYNSSLGEVKIGQMVAWVEEGFQYTPDVYFNSKLLLSDQEGNTFDQIVYFKDRGNKITELREALKSSRNNLKRFDVFIDFTSIANPIEHEKQFLLTRQTKFSLAYSQEVIQPMPEDTNIFYLIKDNQGTELKVFVEDGSISNDFHEIENNFPLIVSPYGFVPMSKMQKRMLIRLKNIATDSSNPRAGLIIKNMMVSDKTDDKTYVLDDKGNPLNKFTHLVGDDVEEMVGNEGFIIKNGENANTDLSLMFDPSTIADVIGTNDNHDFTITSLLTFDYCENKDGLNANEQEFQTFKLPIQWTLQLEPYPEWLCVDYGSSAIVCKYDNQLLNLREQKENVFTDEENNYADFQEDSLEKDTLFLSSDIILHTTDSNQNISALCSEQKEKSPYNTLAVCLSPTSSLIMNSPTTQLPCLKILMGNMFIPDNPFFNEFRYPRIDPQTGELKRVNNIDTKEEKTSLLKVTNIFKESYSALFKYFISPITGDKRKMNKLVLTYPNTYTPVHIKLLKDIAQTTFPYLRPGYLQFVSESDAVAAYYISHWDEFNTGNIYDRHETILVYDMGAGTLDITLFDKFINIDKKVDVIVNGKLGTGKAGNYLDFVLADILSEFFDLDKVYNAKVASTEFVANNAVLKAQHELKNFIKSEVKPNLVNGKTFKYKVGRDNKEIMSEYIMEHPKFRAFLNEVTFGIIQQLCRYMETDKIKIDTVIMSGRSCRLQILRETLRECIESKTKEAPNFVEFDRGNDREKTIVVEGAMAQASIFSRKNSEVNVKSRRLYASYGLVYKELGGSYKYVELLNHRDIPYMDSMSSFDSANIDVFGTASTEYITLIQTYLSANETQKAYNTHNLEFISEMEDYNMADFGHANKLNVKLHLDKNNNISLFVNGLISKSNAPKGVDLTSEVTKRSIWPVTIYTES